MEYEHLYEETKSYTKFYLDGKVYIHIGCHTYYPNGKGMEESFDVENEDGTRPSEEIRNKIIQYAFDYIG